MFTTNRICILLSVIAFAVCLFLNEYNLHILKNEKPEKVSKYNTVATSDDASYINPPINYYKNGAWKDNFIGTNAHFLRAPGYGILHYGFIKIAGGENGLRYVKYFQLILYSLSFFLFSKTLAEISDSKILLILFSSVSMLLLSGFLYYQLTESITVSLSMLLLHCYLKHETKTDELMIAILLSVATITRPFLFIFTPLLSFTKQKSKLLLLVIVLTPTLIWQIRNYNIAKEFTGLHPIYYADNNTIFRPTHQAIWNWVKCFDERGDKFHSYMVPLWENAVKGDTSDIWIQNAWNTINSPVLHIESNQKVFQAFKLYQKASVEQSRYLKSNSLMPYNGTSNEQHCINSFAELEADYKKQFPLRTYILTPLLSLKRLLFHSNLNLYLFQHHWRGNALTETTRVICFFFHALALLSCIFILFLKSNSKIRLMGIICTLYLFYLSFVQVGNEERYTLPILPFALLILYRISATFISNTESTLISAKS